MSENTNEQKKLDTPQGTDKKKESIDLLLNSKKGNAALRAWALGLNKNTEDKK